MQLKSNNQSIIICGNSGSGKTETSKHIISFLCENSEPNIQKKIISSNSLIEVFGNAKTPLNENSSRFVKLIQVKLIHNNETNGIYENNGNSKIHFSFIMMSNLRKSVVQRYLNIHWNYPA